MSAFMDRIEPFCRPLASTADLINPHKPWIAFILPELGDVEVAALTTERIRKWHMDLAKMPARARTRAGEKQQYRLRDDSAEGIRRRQVTANRILRILKTALNRAWRDGQTSSDAVWRRVEPFKSVDAARVRYLTIAEARRLANACRPDFRQLVQAALATGCRYGELAALRVSDFNPDSGTIHVRVTKTGKGRHVVLNDEGRGLFEALTVGRSKNSLLLAKADGAPWGVSNQAEPMAKACAQAKIEPSANFHCLRHTYASLAIMAGAPLIVVAKTLGHASTKMCEQHYGHLSTSYVTDVVRNTAPRFDIKPSRKIIPLR
jgi:integrase